MIMAITSHKLFMTTIWFGPPKLALNTFGSSLTMHKAISLWQLMHVSYYTYQSTPNLRQNSIISSYTNWSRYCFTMMSKSFTNTYCMKMSPTPIGLITLIWKDVISLGICSRSIRALEIKDCVAFCAKKELQQKNDARQHLWSIHGSASTPS